MYQENERTDLLSAPGLEVDGDSQPALESVAKWTKFISITMLIVSALGLILFSIAGFGVFRYMGLGVRFGSRYMSESSALSFGIIMTLMVLFVVAVIIWFVMLYRFSGRLKEALITQDAIKMASAFNALKIHLIFSVSVSSILLLASILNLFKPSELF